MAVRHTIMKNAYPQLGRPRGHASRGVPKADLPSRGREVARRMAAYHLRSGDGSQ